MPRSFTRTLNDLNTKLARQQGAVIATLEMIEAVQALQARENAPPELPLIHNTDTANAPKLTKQTPKL